VSSNLVATSCVPDNFLRFIEEPFDGLHEDVVGRDDVVEGRIGQTLHARVVPDSVHVVLVHGDLPVDLVHQSAEHSCNWAQ